MYELLITLGKGIQQLSFSLIIGAILVNVINFGFNKNALNIINFKLIKVFFLIILVIMPALFFVQTAYYYDSFEFIFDFLALKKTLINTRFGNFWLLKLFLVIVLLLGAYKTKLFSLKVYLILLLLTSSMVAFTGHAAALEYKYISIPISMVHIIAINIWFGTLPFIIKVFIHNKNILQSFLVKFSKIASICMLLITATGFSLTLFNLEFNFAALLGTKYGNLILLKLFFLSFVLVCAFLIKFFYLKNNAYIDVFNILKIELFFAVLVFLVGIVLSQTIPGAHDEINWPLSFRISTEVALENNLNLKILKYICIGTFTIFGIIITDYILNKNLRRFILILCIISITMLPITVSILSVEAYPVTYKTPSVPYTAISVLNGKKLYLNNCTSCHGKSGQGNGELAKELVDLPPANLTEPHTAYHTAGDIYWWLTYGKPPSSMPGFKDILSEDERWDIINYLRTLSAGYEGRIISNVVIKNKPWLASIDFDYVTLNKIPGRLSKNRFNNSVLLIFFDFEYENIKRLIDLNSFYKNYLDVKTKIILIPNFNDNEPNFLSELKSFVSANNIVLPIIYEGANEITETYKLYRRTIEKPDKYDEDENLNYMEILIDKYGYVRARWLLYDDDYILRDKKYFRMLNDLSEEKKILAPPDEHVH